MSKMWPSRKNGATSVDDSPRPSSEHGDHSAASEYTRLLPNRVDSTAPPPGGYLSPDDPAVSPYNLWSVRLVRAFTVVLAAITFIWWALVLVSAFVTPPGLHATGSGWFAFSYATLALATLLVTLLFFTVPSRGERVLLGAVMVLLAVQLVLVLAVERIRHEELWVGVVSLVWLLLMSMWAFGAERTVQWAKREEEERLTGRPETRRTLLEWAGVLSSSIVLAVMLAALVLMTCSLIIRALDAKLAPPGQMYWVDDSKYQIHLYCNGNSTDGGATVLFEGGEDPVEYGLWAFAENAMKNGSIGRYCFADRPGVAWSGTAPSPLSAGMASDALSEALARAGEHGPWLLASAGIGSLYSRVFSSRHGKEIIGILMIDPLHEQLLSRVGSPGRGFVLWLRGVMSPLGLNRVPGAIFRGRSAEDRIWGRSSGQSGKAIFAKLQEGLVADSLTKRDVLSSRAIQRQQTPVVVISSGVEMRRDPEWEDGQRDLTHITRVLEDWDIVEKAPHRVWSTFDGREMIEKRLSKLLRI